MSMDDISTRPLPLDTLLDGILEGRNLLPDFQRDFDWQKPDIVSLIATVLSAWPAGSLLIMKGHPDFFAVREFEYAPKRAEKIDYVILDGQQRLTALNNAFRGAGPTAYIVDTRKLVGSVPYAIDQIEDSIIAMPRSSWEEYSYERQGAEGLIPLSSLASASDYFDWRDAILAVTPQVEREARGLSLTRVYKSLLGNANKYSFPSVMLESDLPSEAVARIFERVNRTGHRLGTFDLLVARTYSSTWNLRDRWEAARRETNYLERFLDEDGTPLLQAIALTYDKDVRQPAVLNLSKKTVQENWDRVVEAFEAALRFVVAAGVTRPQWLPYRSMLLPLAALAMDHELNSFRDLLTRWFWTRAFGQEYDVGSSTRAVADYTELKMIMDGSPGSISPSTLALDDLVDATRKQNGALWRSFIALLNSMNPLDLLSGEDLASSNESVPVSLLNRDDRDPDESHLRILGQVLATRDSARSARSGSLVRQAPGKVGEQARWLSQLLPVEAATYIEGRGHFLRSRAELVATELAQRCGEALRIRIAADGQESKR